MTLLSELEPNVLDRLEEDRYTPQFWRLNGEIRNFLAEAVAEATLLSGEPEYRNPVEFTITKNTRLFTLPDEAVVLLKIDSTGVIPKRTLFDLDRQYPGWEGAASAEKLKAWFPLGMTKFGVYPTLTEDIRVQLTYVQFTLPSSSSYQGNEQFNLQAEYNDGIIAYAAHAARLKEGGAEFSQSMNDYNYFLRKMQELGKFAAKKSAIRFTRTGGIPAKVTDVVVR